MDCDAPELVKDAYALIKSKSHEWANYIHKTLNDSGFPQVWSQPTSVDSKKFLTQLEQRLMDQYIQFWQGELRDSTGKLQSYKQIKDVFQKEMFLTLPHPYLRVPYTRLKISAHSLRIETG